MGNENANFSIIALDKFIQATRDSGYKGTASAISEIVDNSLQANARRIKINLKNVLHSGEPSIEVSILDDGVGMDAFELRTALRFGGSSRFNNRAGLGRYGMGLPNSSLSQAQRLEVYTWREGSKSAIFSYLDLNEIAAGEVDEVPEPKAAEDFIIGDVDFYSGTLVTWHHCDRLDNKRVSTLCRKLSAVLGRKFRYYIWGGVSITINGEAVRAFDPLYLNEDSLFHGASLFAEELNYEIAIGPEQNETGFVAVRFSELPVHEWGRLKNEEKRALGISKGAGVSIVRGSREVDYGWFFFGEKRRENYDDWWRCELHFQPSLDEVFGITHTKQQVRPQQHVLEALTPDLEAIARALNSRVRKAHYDLKLSEKFTESERQAIKSEHLLQPLPQTPRSRDLRVLQFIKPSRSLQNITDTEGIPGANPQELEQKSKIKEFAILPKSINQTTFFDYTQSNGQFILVLNPDHPFYKTVYKPLLESDQPKDSTIRNQLELLILAAARSEAVLEMESEINNAEKMRKIWSDTLATYLSE